MIIIDCTKRIDICIKKNVSGKTKINNSTCDSIQFNFISMVNTEEQISYKNTKIHINEEPKK